VVDERRREEKRTNGEPVGLLAARNSSKEDLLGGVEEVNLCAYVCGDRKVV
jgi:hypothetical protein